MPEKRPSLNVLSGPLAGQVFAIEDAVDNFLIGSDASCGIVLDTPGVSPIHARLWVDLNGATVYDTNSPSGVYVNDDRVVKEAPVRNGDILWLGPPGEEGSVLIQCVLPGRSAPAERTAEPEVAADPRLDEEPPPLPVDTSATLGLGAARNLAPAPALEEAPSHLDPEPEEDATVVMSSSALMEGISLEGSEAPP